jgi:hypothetical protein
MKSGVARQAQAGPLAHLTNCCIALDFPKWLVLFPQEDDRPGDPALPGRDFLGIHHEVPTNK